eukprot:jgi/Psemu1/51154/gm1.51154_g
MSTTNWAGELQGIGTVWFDQDVIANILSLSRVKEDHHTISYDSSIDNVFRMYSKDGTTYQQFKQSSNSLYYMSLQNHAMVFNITTMEKNKKSYSNLDYQRALKACKFQNTINLTTKELASLVDNKLIPNWPVTRTDLIVANRISGKSLATLKGRTTRPIMDQDSNVEIGADIMFVNGIQFFITISRHIQFATVEPITNAKAGMLAACIDNIRQTYAKRGFTVTNAAMDKQFEPIRYQLEEIVITPNYATRDEHTTGYANATRSKMEARAHVAKVMLAYNVNKNQFYQQVYETLLTRYGIKAHLKVFGSRSLQAVKEELQQLHNRKVVKPISSETLSHEQKTKALAYLIPKAEAVQMAGSSAAG